MIARYCSLRRQPSIFRALTGLSVAEFEALVADLAPHYAAAEIARHTRPVRQRAIGAGHPFTLDARAQILLTIVWWRQYPTPEVLGWLFGVSDSTATRTIGRVLPLLAHAGRDTMRLPRPAGRGGKSQDQLLADVPEVLVLIATCEQRVQRPQTRAEADPWYSGKQKQHTMKSQGAVNEATGEIVDVAESVRGPTADITLLKESGLMDRLPEGVGGGGDLAYVGSSSRHPQGLGATPRRKPRGQDRPAEDSAYNRAFARRRIPVEHSIGRLRGYGALSQTDREHRKHHTERVRAVAGLVNRQLRHRAIAPEVARAA